ncbi:MAG: LysE family transporter [Bacteroidaceae bacterium]|nr:LysE family transporter [Bacteroidaceae bacterium]
MLGIEPVTTFELAYKGLIIGIIASAPTGPIGILGIQRILKKGPKYGLVTGAGAVISDLIYGLITALGMSFIMDFMTNKTNIFWMEIIGSAMLFVFGLYMFRSNPDKYFLPEASKLSKGNYVNNFFTSLFLTLSNPLIIFLFIALFARFAFIVPDQPIPQVIGFITMTIGAASWWIVLTYGVDKIRKTFNVKYVRILNLTVGGIVILASLFGFVFTLMGKL